MGPSDTNLDSKTWCLTPTETIRLIRVGAKMGGGGGGGKRRYGSGGRKRERAWPSGKALGW